MNEDIKARWVEALRSGDYEQGRNYLCKDNKFCCLGVLCELAVADDKITKSVGNVVSYNYETIIDLPRSVVEWAGLGTPEFRRKINRLIIMNDSANSPASFKEIADYIEETF